MGSVGTVKQIAATESRNASDDGFSLFDGDRLRVFELTWRVLAVWIPREIRAIQAGLRIVPVRRIDEAAAHYIKRPDTDALYARSRNTPTKSSAGIPQMSLSLRRMLTTFQAVRKSE